MTMSVTDMLKVGSAFTVCGVLLLDSMSLPNCLSDSILIGLADGERFSDADVQRGALNVLINCVCGPSERVGDVRAMFL